jgi:hypothetical protein
LRRGTRQRQCAGGQNASAIDNIHHFPQAVFATAYLTPRTSRGKTGDDIDRRRQLPVHAL